jgi:type I restriction enzyme S subunit
MITGFKPYPAMKDSGLVWVGRVPAHWTLMPNRALMRRRKVLVGRRSAEYRLLSLTKGGVIVRDVESGKGKFSADMGTFQEVRNGDLVFCLFDIPETPRTVGLSRLDGMITGAYTVFECSEPVLSAFLDLFYRAMDDQKLLSPLYSGLRNTIPATRFLSIKTPVPTPAEQAGIVRFLDHQDRRIRRYIRAKQKLIRLLEERKQIIVQRAVTRGLDANVRLKPSGLEWLGGVPENWDVCRAKYLFREVDRRSDKGTELLLSLRMYQGLVPHNEVSETPVPAENLIGFKKVEPGQIVMNRMRATIGLFGIANRPGLVSPDYAVFEPIASMDPTYFLLLFKTPALGSVFRRESKGLGTGSAGFMRLYTDRFGMVQLPVPPQVEQRRIVQMIGLSTDSIDRARERARFEMDLLRDYQTRLMVDVVTGKLDVREAAAAVPDEIDEEDVWEHEVEVEVADAEIDGEDVEGELEAVEA